MKKELEVSLKQLINNKSNGLLPFKTTEEIQGCDMLIGQERAEKAMEFGINIKEAGYNIYISGRSGDGRTVYAREILKQASTNCRVPDDWCYVYNFHNEYEPTALGFESGMGKVFKQDMIYIVDEVIDRIPSAFNSEEYDRQKSEILEDYHEIKNDLTDELNKSAENCSLQVKATSSGFAFIPIVDGKPMSEMEYDTLDKEGREAITKNISSMRVKAIDILRKLKSAEKEAAEKVKSLDKKIGNFVVDNLTQDLKRKYGHSSKIIKYLDNVKEDIMENLDMFIEGINRHSMNKEQQELLARYKVNLVVDNSETRGAPVIYESNPTFSNLIGSVEYESKLMTVTTDFLMIGAGSILKANGGYLIVNANELLKNYKAWDSLKRVISSKELKIEGLRSQLDLLTITSLKPEPIPVEVKVVLIGPEHLYQLLYEIDEEFGDLFKVKVEFKSFMERNDENAEKVSRFIASYCRKKGIRHLNNSGVSALLEYSSRLAGSKKRLSTCLGEITDILEESNVWSNLKGSRLIGREEIKKAIMEKKKRISLVEDITFINYNDNKIVIDVKDKAVGQVNGLAVVERGGHSFGKPYRITASTYMGKSGIINIEREAQMSGNIHNKSIMIISGYLGGKYARDIPLSLTAHICFEQLYGYIDGDSASIAELYAVLSSLSGIPLKQGIAVTGSLNQKGEVQPVGGINEKIEGFHRVCTIYGLNGSQGVIIPYQNVDDILLDDNVTNDIKRGLFHIYAIKNVEEGMEVLTDMPMGKKDREGSFEKDTLNHQIEYRLRELVKNYNALSDLKK